MVNGQTELPNPEQGSKKGYDYLSVEHAEWIFDGTFDIQTLLPLIDESLYLINRGAVAVYFNLHSRKMFVDGHNEKHKGIIDKLNLRAKRMGKRAADTFPDLDANLMLTNILWEEGEAPTDEPADDWYQIILDTNERGQRERREPHERPFNLWIDVNKINNQDWNICVPLLTLFKKYKLTRNGHMGYSHGVAIFEREEDLGTNDIFYYHGITKRHWVARMKEHFREIETGSNKLFHKTWRAFLGDQRVRFYSFLRVVGMSFDEIMKWEERVVDEDMAKNRSLNMIPGGYKGLQFLHEHRLTVGVRGISIEDRNTGLGQLERGTNRGPNAILKALWMNDEYALKIICGGEGRLSPEQVRLIRILGQDGLSIEEIVLASEARNDGQVKRVLSGKSYSRVT